MPLTDRVQLLAARLGDAAQAKIATASGASSSVVNQWFTGNIKSIAPRYAFALEETLGVSARWLMLGTGDPWPKGVARPPREEFKDRLKRARADAGLTQSQIAKVVGCTQSTISDLETGDSKISTLAFTLADACRVSARWLVSGDGDPNDLEHEHEDLRDMSAELRKATDDDVDEQQPQDEGVDSPTDIIARNLAWAFRAAGSPSMREVAAHSGVSPSTVRTLLQPGLRSPIAKGPASPTVDVLARVAHALSLQPWQLMVPVDEGVPLPEPATLALALRLQQRLPPERLDLLLRLLEASSD